MQYRMLPCVISPWAHPVKPNLMHSGTFVPTIAWKCNFSMKVPTQKKQVFKNKRKNATYFFLCMKFHRNRKLPMKFALPSFRTFLFHMWLPGTKVRFLLQC